MYKPSVDWTCGDRLTVIANIAEQLKSGPVPLQDVHDKADIIAAVALASPGFLESNRAKIEGALK